MSAEMKKQQRGSAALRTVDDDSKKDKTASAQQVQATRQNRLKDNGAKSKDGDSSSKAIKGDGGARGPKEDYRMTDDTSTQLHSTQHESGSEKEKLASNERHNEATSKPSAELTKREGEKGERAINKNNQRDHNKLETFGKNKTSPSSPAHDHDDEPNLSATKEHPLNTTNQTNKQKQKLRHVNKDDEDENQKGKANEEEEHEREGDEPESLERAKQIRLTDETKSVHRSTKLTAAQVKLPTWTEREEALTQLLSKFREHSYYYLGFRANHGSQGTVALYRLGAKGGDSEASKRELDKTRTVAAQRVAGDKTLKESLNAENGELDPAPTPVSMWEWWYGYSARFEPMRQTSIMLTPSTWMCYLGRREAYPAYLEYFTRELNRMQKERDDWQTAYAKALVGDDAEVVENGVGKQWENVYAWMTPQRMREWRLPKNISPPTDSKQSNMCSAAICMPPWRRLLRAYFTALAPGMAGGAFHGCIQIGWSLPVVSQAIRALKRIEVHNNEKGESKSHLSNLEVKYERLARLGVQMLIEGLAWMAATHAPLDPGLQLFSPEQRTNNIAKIAANASMRHSEAAAVDSGPYEERENRSSTNNQLDRSRNSDSQTQASLGPGLQENQNPDICNQHPELARGSFDAACGACLAGFGRIHQALGLIVNQLQQSGITVGKVESPKLKEILDRSGKYPYTQVDAAFFRRVWSVCDEEMLRPHINGASTYAVERMVALAYDRDARGRARGIVEPVTTMLTAAALLCNNDFFVLHLATCWFGLRQILHHLDIGQLEKAEPSASGQNIQKLFSDEPGKNERDNRSSVQNDSQRVERRVFKSPFVQVVRNFLQCTFTSYVAQGCPASDSPELQHALNTGLGVFALLGHPRYDPVKNLNVIPSWRVVIDQMEPLVMSDVHRAKLAMVMLLDAAASSVETSTLADLNENNLTDSQPEETKKESDILELPLSQDKSYKVSDALEGAHLLGVLSAYARSGPDAIRSVELVPRQVRNLDTQDIARSEWLDKVIRLTALKASTPFRFGHLDP